MLHELECVECLKAYSLADQLNLAYILSGTWNQLQDVIREFNLQLQGRIYCCISHLSLQVCQSKLI